MSEILQPQGTNTSLRIPPRVLLIGRSYKDAAQLVQLLISEEYLVISELDTERSLAKLRTVKFRLIILDIDVTGVAGEKFIATLRRDEQLKALPLLVMSQAVDMEGVERCLEFGADDYIPAGVGPFVLRTRINGAIDRRSLQDGANLRREMSVARTIQRDFLPETLPDVGGLQLEAALRPAKDVSGDFYDCFLLASGEVILVLGDVCDKGVGAALFMALFRSLIRASADPVGGGAVHMIGGSHTMVMQALESASPAELLVRVASFTNDYIARLHGRTNMFATVFLASIEPFSGELVYVNAGHEPGLIIAPDGSIEELRPTGPALGMMPDSRFTAVTRKLERDHTLFAFTDGVVEAHSSTGDVYGWERLREALQSQRNGTASDAIREVLDSLEKFGGQSDPHDDVTMISARLV